MCGIFGYISGDRKQPVLDRVKTRSGEIGNKKLKKAAEIVFEGLRRLEYRGYDSFGLAVQIPNSKFQTPKLLVEKHVGKIGNSILNSQFSIQILLLVIPVGRLMGE